MDIKSWILLIGTTLILAVICHGFWTAYRARKNDVRMEIETDIPEGDLDEMVLLRGELPNGGARVTPTVGFEALRIKDRSVIPADELPLDEVVAFAEEGLFDEPALQSSDIPDEGNLDAGYEPEQASLDLALDEAGGLEERYAARIAAARLANNGVEEQAATTALLSSAAGAKATSKKAPLLVDAAQTSLGARPADALPPKKMVAAEERPLPRKQFEPPLPSEIEAEEAAARLAQEKALLEQEQARLDAQARADKARAAEALAVKQAKEAEARAAEERRLAAEALAAKKQTDRQRIAEQKQAEADRIARLEREKRVRAEARKAIETPEQPQLAFTQDEPTQAPKRRDTREQRVESNAASGGEELVVLNVIAKSAAFHGGDVLELFLRNGIKFGDMNIFHRIDPVSKASQYSIASLTEPGYFDLRTMDTMQIKGLCLFMQLPGPGQPTKVFTDMLTVADKLARQLDAEVCDEQFNRLTRQSTEHYRQRVAEFTRRQMTQRALV